MSVPSPNEFSLELLAAYADGELDPIDSAWVERWLADHPEALDELKDQKDLASNSTLWESAQAPEPAAKAWALVHDRIEAELWPGESRSGERTPGRRVTAWVLAGLTLGGVAAAVLWLAFASFSQQPAKEILPPAEFAQEQETNPAVAPTANDSIEPSDSLDAIAVLPIPSDDDVILDRVPEFTGGWLPVGRHPVPGVLALATVEELTLEEVSPSPAWPTNGGPKMTNAPGDAPMVFAAKPR